MSILENIDTAILAEQAQEPSPVYIEEHIKLSSQQEEAVNSIIDPYDNRVILLYGKAGVGKSMTLQKAITEMYRRGDSFAVVGPTGVAALNVGGVTIHKLFRLQPQDNLHSISNKRVKDLSGLRLLIIDEVSMVRADMLDMIDIILRNSNWNDSPFGGVKVVLVGDPMQLPPVVTTQEKSFISKEYGGNPFFFASHVFKKCEERGHVKRIELTEVFRQKDQRFINMLNCVRGGKKLDKVSKLLSSSKHRVNGIEEAKGSILVASNSLKDAINDQALSKLEGEPITFNTEFSNEHLKHWQYPVPIATTFKVGIRAMIIKNLYQDEVSLLAANGDLGVVESINYDEHLISIRLDRTGDLLEIGYMQWIEYQTIFDPTTHRLSSKKLTDVKAVPAVCAAAITVHKAQGKTLEEATIDIRGGMKQAGQLYTALTRLKSLEGLRVLGKVDEGSFVYSKTISEFMKNGKREIG